jgi:tRNA(Leu) C34 or U34 (ribose-2'-O)-methylase TrmL
MSNITSFYIDKNPKSMTTPSIILTSPKFTSNLLLTVKLASCYGINQVWFTGNRLEYSKRMLNQNGNREVDIINYDRPFDFMPANAVPVAVEVRENSEVLHQFEHPENAVYVFGQEDGSIPKQILHLCHRFVVIPSRHCLNLATATATILWDREYKKYLNGGQSVTEFTTPSEFEHRGYSDFDHENLFVSGEGK